MDGSKHVKCERCRGTGEYTVRLGLSGQDTYTPGEVVEEGEGWNARRGSGYSFAEVEWGDTYGPYACGACLGTGWRKPRKDRPESGSMHVHYTPAEQMSFDDIFDNMSLSER